jgi:hypothetical protein
MRAELCGLILPDIAFARAKTEIEQADRNKELDDCAGIGEEPDD